MNTKIETYLNNDGERIFEYVDIPDECPYCHMKIQPKILTAYADDGHFSYGRRKISQVVLQCPNKYCGNLFIAKYLSYGAHEEFHFENILSIEPKSIEFSTQICTVSPNFPTIYNQAYCAEQYELRQICGPGYRKALEYLIKDFAIYSTNNEAEKEQIRKKLLSRVINDHISDPQIKKVAPRAAWLGNDETHYLRIWEQQDLTDLKILIELSIRFIESILLTKHYEEQMPDK